MKDVKSAQTKQKVVESLPRGCLVKGIPCTFEFVQICDLVKLILLVYFEFILMLFRSFLVIFSITFPTQVAIKTSKYTFCFCFLVICPIHKHQVEAEHSLVSVSSIKFNF